MFDSYFFIFRYAVESESSPASPPPLSFSFGSFNKKIKQVPRILIISILHSSLLCTHLPTLHFFSWSVSDIQYENKLNFHFSLIVCIKVYFSSGTSCSIQQLWKYLLAYLFFQVSFSSKINFTGHCLHLGIEINCKSETTQLASLYYFYQNIEMAIFFGCKNSEVSLNNMSNRKANYVL